jgi:hypothetical protein
MRMTLRLAIASGVAGLCAAMAAHAEDWVHPGMLRVRDLTPFGLLRLDLRPPHWLDAPEHSWMLELELSYQNTFVLSGNVERYLRTRDAGRVPIRPEDVAAIYDLPGDAYYIDGEVGVYELIAYRKLNRHWTAFLSVPYLSYGKSLLDGTIEGFHEAFGFDQQGRNLVARNSYQFVYDIGGMRSAQLNRTVNGGLGDPVFGARYSFPRSDRGWDLVAELAAKVAVDGQRSQLSTGASDYGLQLGARRIWGRHAVYFAGSAVYFAGGPGTPADRHFLPTLHAAYGYGLTPRSSLMLQGYLSASVVQHTDVRELSDNTYQLSLGLQHRRPRTLWTFAAIENVSNFDNTPDIVVQLGVVLTPAGGQ